MIRYITLPIIIFLSVISLNAQRFTDIGIFGGASMYMGDINPDRYLYSPSPAFGGFFRVNINKRVALRVNGIYANLSGSDEDFPDRVLTSRFPTSFTNSLMDFNAQVEFNWLPYITGEDQWMNALYVSGGLGYTIFTGSENSLTIPFGLGCKINITDRLSAGLEWSYRKTFKDDLDSVVDPLENTLINNNDWYSLIGLFISYKFVKFAADCPAYK
jgi:hypothetical protein